MAELTITVQGRTVRAKATGALLLAGHPVRVWFRENCQGCARCEEGGHQWVRCERASEVTGPQLVGGIPCVNRFAADARGEDAQTPRPMLWSEVFLGEPGEWYWCLHCERVWRREAWERNGLDCPTPGCDGGLGDMWEWSKHRDPQGNCWPEVPEEGAEYALYP